MTKRHQEEMSLLIGKSYGIPTVALRFFNVYGPGQSLSNPYTGVVAIFLSRLINRKPPLVFEDGNQTRDFIYVDDLARAIVDAMESKKVENRALNVGTGRTISVGKLASTLADLVAPSIQSKIGNNFRTGDIRHCYADTHLIRDLLGFEAKIRVQDGLARLIGWGTNKSVVARDNVQKALDELSSRSLSVGV
jgi:dTDP-L-rhamnose 4-epimerase